MTKLTITAGFTCLFALAALFLTSYHTKMRCHTEFVGDINANECPPSYEENCPGAYAIFSQGTLSGTSFEVSYKCPWEKSTAVLGLLGLSLTPIFLGLLLAATKKKAFKLPMVILAGVIIPILIASLRFMMRDLKNGFEYNEQQGTHEGFRPGTYLANAVLLMFEIGMIAGAAIIGLKSGEQDLPGQYGNINTQRHPTPAELKV